MDTLIADIRYGLRLLVQQPGTTLVVLLTLALGIGANTAIFSVVNGVLLEPLPYEAPEDLVVVWQDHTRIDGPATEWASPDNFFDWREQNELFDGMFALGGFRPTLSGVDEPEQLSGAVASYDALSILGLEPMLGREFRAEEDAANAELVVILGYALWQRRFGGSGDVLGRSITLDGEPATIVGVLPRDVDFPFVGSADVLAPLRVDRTNSCGRGCVTLRVIGRIQPGVGLARARAEMNAIAARLEHDYPDDNVGVGVNLVPLHEQITGPMRAGLLLLLGAVGLVLLVACANVANLMLARAADREREVATRIAMGASRGRLFRQLLTESLMLAVLGSALGLVLALWGVDFLVTLIPESVPRFSDVRVDATALGFTLVAAVVTGLVFGLVPAVRGSTPDLHGSLKEGGRGSSAGSQRFRGALVVSEVAVAVTLLVGAGLLMRSFATLMRVDPGFETENLVTAQLNLVGVSYDETAQRVSFVQRLLERVRALPGVDGAGVIHVLPMSGMNADAGFLIEGREPPRPGQTPVAWYRPASPGYFDAMKMRLERGRWFSEADDAEAPPVVLINQAAAERYWANEDPLQSRVRIGGAWRLVVGVVADTKHFGLDQAERPAMYFPYDQLPLRFMSLVVRTGGDPAATTDALAGAIRNAVWELDSTLAISSIAPMEDVVADTVARPRIVTSLLVVFALSALALAAIGLYGVMSYSVRQRTREIGIRMALGAKSGDVLRWTVGRGMSLMLLGAAVGIVSALAATRLIESLLFGVAPTDPVSFAAAPVVLAAVAFFACYLPARRAASVDPIVALRYE